MFATLQTLERTTLHGSYCNARPSLLLWCHHGRSGVDPVHICLLLLGDLSLPPWESLFEELMPSMGPFTSPPSIPQFFVYIILLITYNVYIYIYQYIDKLLLTYMVMVMVMVMVMMMMMMMMICRQIHQAQSPKWKIDMNMGTSQTSFLCKREVCITFILLEDGYQILQHRHPGKLSTWWPSSHSSSRANR